MATDSTHLLPGNSGGEADLDMAAGGPDLGSVQLAAATPDAPIPVDIPRGQQIVVIPVRPGQTIELPTDSPNGLLAKLGADGNLAIVVDGRTIILQGYAEANAESPIKIVTSDGDLIDVAEVIVATNPDVALDIQTAAGPAAGAQGGTDGADAAGSGIFVPFAAGPLLGGFDAEGTLKATQLAYKNIDDERIEFIVQEEEPEEPNNPPTIDFEPQNPEVKDGRAVVSDEGFQFGNKDSDPSPQDESDSTSTSGQFVVSDPDVGDVLTVELLTDGLPAALGNDPVTWILAPDGHTMTGQTNGSDAIVITISSVDGFTYDYDVVLKKPLSHTDPTLEDEIDFNLTVKVTDSKGLFDTAQLAVQIEDDSPVADAFILGNETVLVTKDENTDGDPTDEDTAQSALFNVFGLTISMGADLPGSPPNPGTLSLELLVAEGTASGLTIGGTAINLFSIGGAIVGSTAADEGDVDASNTVFSVSLSGFDVVLTQFQQIDHTQPDSAPAYNDDVRFIGDGKIGITNTVELTDEDGDTDTDSATIDIGGRLGFADDGPLIDVVAAGEADIVLDTQDAQTDGDPTTEDTDVSSADFSGVFKIASFSHGADGAGTISDLSYDLDLAVAEGSASGLKIGGVDINLFEIGGVIVGSTETDESKVGDPDDVVFTVAVDTDGKVTLTQFQQIDHNKDETEPTYDDDQQFLADGKITLTASATITDSEGDSATDKETVDLGGNLRFDDDGPFIDVVKGTEADVVLETFDAKTDGDPTDEDVATSSADFSGVFTIGTAVHGADGPGKVSELDYELNLAVKEGTASGLTIGGAAINLFEIGGVIVGSTETDETKVDDSDTVFTVSVDADGKVTLTQLQQIDHDKDETEAAYDDDTQTFADGLVTLTASATVTDSEGDSDTDSETIDLGGNLVFHDDGPSLEVVRSTLPAPLLATQDAETDGNPTDTDTDSASFKGVFTALPTFGADGPGTVSDFDFELDLLVKEGSASGLTIGGVAINLFEIGGVIVGSTETDEANVDATDTVFTVSVDINGNVTLTQHQQIDHDKDEASPTYDDDQKFLGEGKIGLTASATVTDSEGDSATASKTVDIGNSVRFDDDGPSIDLSGTNENSVVLDTQDAQTIGGASDTATSQADFSGVFGITGSAFGADGPGTISAADYDLSLFVAEGTASGLTIGGVAINLFEIGGVIVGSTETDEGKVDVTDTVFTVSVDGDGKVTLTQFQQIDHDKDETAPTYDDDQRFLSDGLIKLSASATITDFEGDSNTGSAFIDLGNNLRFDDDGPFIDVVKGTEADVLLETYDAKTDGDPTNEDVATSSADFSGVFTIGTAVHGADGPGKVSELDYELNLAVKEGTASGLTIGGAAINLFEIGGVIVGSTETDETKVDDTDTVFTVSVDADGKVTLTQLQQIDHDKDETEAAYDDDTQTIADGLVTLTASATVTDSEGDSDTDSETIDLGGNLVFHDDGPSIEVTQTTVPAPTLDTQDAETDGVPTNDDTDTASFKVLFGTVTSFGADGPGTVSDLEFDLDLLVKEGSASGLTIGGVAINLFEIGGVIVGSTETDEANVGVDDTVFTVKVDVAGNVTLTQLQQIDHDKDETAPTYDDDQKLLGEGKIGLTASATITDSEGDSATASKTIDLGNNIRFDDDGPSIDVTATSEASVVLNTQDAETIGGASDTASSTADFSDVFKIGSSSYGADGPGTTSDLSYELGFALGFSEGDTSGLKFGGVDIRLYQDPSGLIIGSTAATEGTVDAGNTVFTVAVDADGKVTLTQLQQVDHNNDETAPTYDDDEIALAAGKLTLTATATITDFEGDSATDKATIDLGGNLVFDDDGPFIDVTATNEANIVLNTQDAETIGGASDTASSTADFSGVFKISSSLYGADGAGTTSDLSYDLGFALGFAEGDTSGLKFGGVDIRLYQDPSGLIIGSTAATEGTIDAGNTVFTVAVDADGKVTLTQLQQIDHNVDETEPTYDDDEIALAAGKLTLTATATITDFEGDSATDKATIDLGGNLVFDDDGPFIDVTATNEANIVLNTQDAETIGGASDTASSTADFSDVFKIGSSSYGADGPGTTSDLSYELGFALGFSEGDASGLKIGGVDIQLYQDPSGLIIGSTAADEGDIDTGNTVFTVAVDADGKVTLTQLQQVDHNVDETAPTYDDDEIALAAGKLTLTATATITDFEGDSATDKATIDLGGNLVFDDDGPFIDVTATNEANIVLNTQDAETIGGASDTASSTADFSDVFKISSSLYGADGAGTTSDLSYDLGFALGFAEGDTSGLKFGGVDIRLYQDPSGLVIGSTAATEGTIDAGNTVFTVAVDADGKVTLTQLQQIDHNVDETEPTYDDDEIALAAGKLTLTATATITDFEGDSATDKATIDLGGNLVFDDDGPSVLANLTVQLDDDDVAGAGGNPGGTNDDAAPANEGGTLQHTFGADGAGSVLMANTGTLPVGLGFTQALSAGDTILTISQNGVPVLRITVTDTVSGAYTVEQLGVIDHPAGDTENNLQFNIAYKVTDSEGDSATGSLVINVDDDTPVAVDDLVEVGTSGSVIGNVLTDGIDDKFGADGQGTPAITQVVFKGAAFVDGTDGLVDGVIHVTGDFGNLELNTATGAYTYTRTSPVLVQGSDTFTYTIQDGDGDTDTADLTLQTSAANILNGVFITNTNSTDQPLVLTFQQVNKPIHFSAKLYSLNAQGQQGTVTQDVGFFIDPTKQFMYSVEAGETTSFTNIIVTDFSLEGTDLNAAGGSDNWQLRYDDDQGDGGGSRDLAYSGVFNPSTKTETETDQPSRDGDDTADSLTDPNTGGAGLDYQFGAAGADTLNGSAEADILNGGNGIDQLLGNGGNDVLVYDAADVSPAAATGKIDGGTGADVLRIDDGALAIFFGTPNSVVNLVGADITNIEVIGLTEEVVSDATKGTTIKLSAADVLAFADDSLDADGIAANTIYIVGSKGDKVQLASNGAGFNDSDLGTAGIQTATFFDDGEGQVFAVYTTTGGGTLYVDKDITVETVA